MMARSRQFLVVLGLLALSLVAACSAGGSPAPGSGSPTGSGSAVSPKGTASAPGGGGAAGSAGPAANAPAPRVPPPIPADRQVSIVFESYNLASAGIGRDGTQQLIDEFMAQHPNIQIEGRGVPGAEILASAQTQVVAGAPPDVTQLIFSDLDFIVNNLRPKSLNELAPADELAAHFQGFHPNGKKLVELNGKMYGMPYVFSTPTLFYNADLFRAAGLDPDKPPATWAEVKVAGRAIVDKTGKGGINIACLGPGAFDWCLQGIIRSNGGRVLSEDRQRLLFGEPESAEALAMWQDLVNSGVHQPINGPQAQEAFMGGNIGMYLQTSALQNVMINAAKDKWELRSAPMPAFAGKPVRPTNSGSALFVLADDPLKQRAAWEFLKFVSSERGYTIITSRIGYLPLRPAIVDDPRYLQSYLQENKLIQPNLKQLDSLEPWVSYPGPNYRQILEILTKAAEQVVYNGADARKTMAEAQARAAELMPKR